jgi:hypothetical protein
MSSMSSSESGLALLAAPSQASSLSTSASSLLFGANGKEPSPVPAVQDRCEVLYALVVRSPDMTVLARHLRIDNPHLFEEGLSDVLARLADGSKDKNARSYVFGECAFHALVDHSSRQPSGCSLVTVCMTDRKFPRAVAFNFLAALLDTFQEQFAEEAVRTAPAHHMQVDFNAEIQALMEKYNDKDSDRLRRTTEKINEVHRQTLQAIDKLFERQENIEVLLQASQALNESSVEFRRQTQTLNRQERCKALRCKIWACVLLSLITLIVVGFVIYSCRHGVGHCFEDEDSHSSTSFVATSLRDTMQKVTQWLTS